MKIEKKSASVRAKIAKTRVITEFQNLGRNLPLEDRAQDLGAPHMREAIWQDTLAAIDYELTETQKSAGGDDYIQVILTRAQEIIKTNNLELLPQYVIKSGDEKSTG